MPTKMKTNPLTGSLTFTSLKPPDLSSCTRDDLKAYFENSYDLNESLFTGLKDDSSFTQYPDYLRLPLLFYYGHTACVYMNKLILADFIKPSERVNFEYEKLFETGVDEMSWDDTENFRMGGKFDWPAVADVVEYRRQVRELILRRIDETELSLPITRQSPWWGLVMCMEHERIHLETSSVLIRQLPIDMVTKPNDWNYAPAECGKGVTNNPMIRMERSEVTIGKPLDFPSYGWDNEYGEWTTKVPAFEASKFLITNKEFLEFVEANCYSNKTYWTSEGWEWVQFKQAKHPIFWICDKGCKGGCGGDLAGYSHCKPAEHLTNGQNGYCNGHSQVDENGHQGKDEGGGHNTQFRFRCMFDVIDMPWDWPVEVNYHEAKAYCAWKGPGYRLPAEVEHHMMRGPQGPFSDGTNCDIIFQNDIDANMNLNYGSSTPVNMHSASGAGFHDVFGNVWEWVEDHFNGLPGGSTDPLYDDFSTPCYDGHHTIILGGSWVSTGDEASRFARFSFRRHFFQHLGFRMARSVEQDQEKIHVPIRLVSNQVFALGAGTLPTSSPLDEDRYSMVPVETTNRQIQDETIEILNRQLYEDYTGNLTQTIATYITKMQNKYFVYGGRGLHIGCGTGALTFNISSNFSELLSTDYCGRFLDCCNKIMDGEAIPYFHPNEEKQGYSYHAVLPPGAITDNIVFKQLTWLPNEVQDFDVVLITNIKRLLTPKAWFLRLREVVRKKGILMITTAGQWDANELNTNLGHCFNLEECYGVDATKEGSTVLTVWTHK